MSSVQFISKKSLPKLTRGKSFECTCEISIFRKTYKHSNKYSTCEICSEKKYNTNTTFKY